MLNHRGYGLEVSVYDIESWEGKDLAPGYCFVGFDCHDVIISASVCNIFILIS